MTFNTKKEAAKVAAKLKTEYKLGRQWRTKLESLNIDSFGDWRIRFLHKNNVVILVSNQNYYSAYLLFLGGYASGTGKTPLVALDNAKKQLLKIKETIQDVLIQCEAL